METNYSVSDGYSNSKEASVKINVIESLSGYGITIQTVMNKEVSVTMKGTGPDMDKLNFSLDLEESKGTVKDLNTETGTFIYVPPTNFVGSLSFHYTVSDGDATADGVATVGVTNNPPVLKQKVIEKHLLVGETIDLKISDLGSDADGHRLQFIQNSLDLGSAEYKESSQTLTYTASMMGTATLKYKLSDGNAESEEGKIKFVVCKAITKMGIYTDNYGGKADGSIINEAYLGDIIVYNDNDRTAEQTYGYADSSAHLPASLGVNLNSKQSNVFFVQNSGGLNLYMIHNIHDQDYDKNIVEWDITVKGNDNQDFVKVSDDPKGLKIDGVSIGEPELYPDSSNGMVSQTYQGLWTYSAHTDGGVIGPIVNSEVFIAVKYISNGNLANIDFYSSNGSTISLKKSNFIISTKVPDKSICQ